MNSDGIARTPEPPYWTVVFTSLREDRDDGYGPVADRMIELAREQDGFLGVETARGEDGIGITVSYWRDLGSLRAWGLVGEHRSAQSRGKTQFYDAYSVRIAKVEEARGLGLD